ncbi:uridine kinase [Candidatus Bathyarchaeota archaeon]|nr:uridine kinase [Candidatus Bathyarchaeota archaeon]
MVDRETLLRGIAEMINSMERIQPTRVAIDGVDAAGKTMFADELRPNLEAKGREVIRASIDGFHNPRKLRYIRGRLDPEGYYIDSFNYRALLEQLLQPLGPAGSLNYRTQAFDYRIDRAVDAPVKKARRDSVLLFDGVFLLRPELVNLWDLRIYLDVTFEESLRRGLERDPGNATEIEEQYMSRYIPGQKLYHIHCSPPRKADIVIDNNDVSHPKITYMNPDL